MDPTAPIKDIPEFSAKLDAGAYGDTIHRVAGKAWTKPIAVEWDLSAFEGLPSASTRGFSG